MLWEAIAGRRRVTGETWQSVLQARIDDSEPALEEVCPDAPQALVAIESCGSSHHWARLLESFGHEVKLIPPQYVKPYVKRGKNDATDADALCEAVTRPSMRFVPIKSEDQQSVLLVHRARELLVGSARSWSMPCADTWPSLASLLPKVSRK